VGDAKHAGVRECIPSWKGDPSLIKSLAEELDMKQTPTIKGEYNL